MTIVKSRPTSPGRRFRVKITNSELYKGQPHEPLLTKLNKSGGRNNQGRITLDISVMGIKKDIELLTLKETKTTFQQQSKDLSTTQIGMQI